MQRSFQQLPESVQDQFEALTKKPAPGFFVAALPGIGSASLAVILGGLILSWIGSIAVDSSARSPIEVAYAGGAGFLAFLLVVFGTVRIVQFRRSRVRPAIIVTPIIIAETGIEGEPVRMYYLNDIQDSSITHHYTNGGYRQTTFSFKFSDGSITGSLKPRATADAMIDHIRYSIDILQSWEKAGTLHDRLAQLDWIAQANQAGAAVAEVKSRSFWCSPWKQFGVVAVAALGLWLMVWHLNETRRDIQCFALAQRNQRASYYRLYLREFAHGRHAAEARAQVRDLYQQAERGYLAKVEKANPQAAAGMRALLAYLCEQQSPVVGICFMPVKGIEGDALDRQAAESTHSTHVQSVGPSFTAARNQQREGRIVAVMKESFRKVFSDDLFDLQHGSMDGTGPRFCVNYQVAGSGSIYQEHSQRDLPLDQQDIFIGIEIAFNFTLQVPGSENPLNADSTQGFSFSMSAKPAPNFTVAGGATSDATNVYDRMAATAFEAFEVQLANAYGLELVMPKDWGHLPADQPTRPFNPHAPIAPLTAGLPSLSMDSIHLDALIDRVLDERTPPAQVMATVIARAKADGVPVPAKSALATRITRRTALHALPPSTPDKPAKPGVPAK